MVIYVGGVEHTVILGKYLFSKLSNSEFFVAYFFSLVELLVHSSIDFGIIQRSLFIY